jgi:peptidoglycan/xylan/chitin deacetylase (PgdA/CDA1 family)
MRARTVAAGLVVLGVVGSIGIVFAQKGLPWPAGASSQAAAPPPAAAPAPTTTATAEPRQVVRPASPVAEATIVAQAGGMPRASAPAPAPAPAAAPAPSGPPMPPASTVKGPACTNPSALGVARVVEIDTTGGPGFGFEHFKQFDFLKPGEVVLTFDDGPWLGNTPAVLRALEQECVKAVFFSIGKHATYYPDILRQVYEGGHSVGSHTWSHVDLSKKSPDEQKEEIEKGISAVKAAIGHPIVPFFRFPQLKHPAEAVAYLGDRNIAIFSTDLDSFDFKIRKPEQIVAKVMDKLKKHGKGIVLMHDFQHGTSLAVPQLLAELKKGGYKVVHMVARNGLDSRPQYDAMIAKNEKLPTAGAGRPINSVVRTVE